MLVPSHPLAQKARDNGYGIGAFNVSNLDTMGALIAAAEKHNSPVLAMVWSGAVEYIDFESLTLGLVSMAGRASVPVSLHLDHSYSLDLISNALDLGFTSVMFDGSALGFDENVRKTQEARKMADAAGASLEGVIGEIGEEHSATTGGKPAEVTFTDPDQAIEYFNQTKVDLLAIAVGTQHGHYAAGCEVKLNVELAKDVSARTHAPLVLHGGSYAPVAQVRELIAAGVAKVNVATELEDAFLEAVREIDLNDVKFTSQLTGAGVAGVQARIEDKIHAFGSDGKA